MSAPGPAAAPPGRGRYLVALLIFLLGMAAMAAFLASRLTAMQDDLARLVVPGETTLTLAAGGYTIFHETQGVIDGKIYASPGLDGLAVTVTAPDGKAVPLAPAGAGRYAFDGHTGVSVFDFTAAADGDYVVAARYDGASGPQTVLAVGPAFMSSLLGTIFGGIGIALAGSVIAAWLFVTTIVQRRRAGFGF